MEGGHRQRAKSSVHLLKSAELKSSHKSENESPFGKHPVLLLAVVIAVVIVVVRTSSQGRNNLIL